MSRGDDSSVIAMDNRKWRHLRFTFWVSVFCFFCFEDTTFCVRASLGRTFFMGHGSLLAFHLCTGGSNSSALRIGV